MTPAAGGHGDAPGNTPKTPGKLSLTLEPIRVITRSRVGTRMGRMQGTTTTPYLLGMARSCDAAEADSRPNPKGRASFPACRRYSDSTTREGSRLQTRSIGFGDLSSSPSRLGLRQNPLRRGPRSYSDRLLVQRMGEGQTFSSEVHLSRTTGAGHCTDLPEHSVCAGTWLQ